MQKKTALSKKTIFKKRPSNCPSLGGGSCNSRLVCNSQENIQKNSTVQKFRTSNVDRLENHAGNGCKSKHIAQYTTRFFYNSCVKPKVIEASLAIKGRNGVTSAKNVIRTRIFGKGTSPSLYDKPKLTP